MSEEDGDHDDGEPDEGPAGKKDGVQVALVEYSKERGITHAEASSEEAGEHEDKLDDLENTSGSLKPRSIHFDGHPDVDNCQMIYEMTRGGAGPPEKTE